MVTSPLAATLFMISDMLNDEANLSDMQRKLSHVCAINRKRQHALSHTGLTFSSEVRSPQSLTSTLSGFCD
jgi:hypothetical protein